jgi:hypothetical protein
MFPVDVQTRSVLIQEQTEARRLAMSPRPRHPRVRPHTLRPASTLRPATQGR